jgi:hypothetical protein
MKRLYVCQVCDVIDLWRPTLAEHSVSTGHTYAALYLHKRTRRARVGTEDQWATDWIPSPGKDSAIA